MKIEWKELSEPYASILIKLDGEGTTGFYSDTWVPNSVVYLENNNEPETT